MTTLEAVTDADLRKHRPMVRAIARRLISKLPSNIECDDLEQVGLLAVATSLGRFDPEKVGTNRPEDLDLAFARFAKPRIRGAMLDQLRTDDDFASRHERRLQRDAAEATQELLGSGVRPTSQAIAEHLGVRTSQIDALDRIPAICFLTPKDGEEGDGLPDFTDGVTAEDEASRAQMLQGVLDALETLPPRLQTVITLRYVDGLTWRQIGARFTCRPDPARPREQFDVGAV